MICSICGKKITGNKSIDHIFPREIAKWKDSEEVRSIIENKLNKAPAHKECNYEKQDRLPDLSHVYIPEKQRVKLRERIYTIESAIEEHEAHKAQLRQTQQDICYCCGKVLDHSGILRRIDAAKERTWDNACLVCPDCNNSRVDFVDLPSKGKNDN